jgi:hypothetical protein
MYVAVLTAIIFVYGLVIWISGQTELRPEVRKNLAPEDVEAIYEELQYRCLVGLLLMLISFFPVMIYLCLSF